MRCDGSWGVRLCAILSCPTSQCRERTRLNNRHRRSHLHGHHHKSHLHRRHHKIRFRMTWLCLSETKAVETRKDEQTG